MGYLSENSELNITPRMNISLMSPWLFISRSKQQSSGQWPYLRAKKGLKKLQSIHNKVSETKQEIDDLKRLQVEELKERNRRVEARNSLLSQQTEGFSVDSTLKV